MKWIQQFQVLENFLDSYLGINQLREKKDMKILFLLVHQIPYSNGAAHYFGRKVFRRVTVVAE